MAEKKTSGKVLAWILGIILIAAGLLKLFQISMVVQTFQGWNLAYLVSIIGVIEIVIGALFIASRTHVWGSFLLSAYMGGAIVTHLANREIAFALLPLVFLVVAGIALYLRKPTVFRV